MQRHQDISTPKRTGELAYTLLELLIVLGLLAFLAGWAYTARPSHVGRAAAALRSQVVQARFAAAARNEPVAVVHDPAGRSFVTRATGGIALPDGCSLGEELFRLRLDEFPRVGVAEVPGKGIVWLPNGSGRTCDGGGAFNQTIGLADPVREARVIISRAGRVRSEVGL